MEPVQWPPAESEQIEKEKVEVLQKHLPTKRTNFTWPPPEPTYVGKPAHSFNRSHDLTETLHLQVYNLTLHYSFKMSKLRHLYLTASLSETEMNQE